MGIEKLGSLMAIKELGLQSKWSGFQKALADYGYPICENWITDAEFVGRSGYEAVKRLWKDQAKSQLPYVFLLILLLAVH